MIDDLPQIIQGMKVNQAKSNKKRVRLEDNDYIAIIQSDFKNISTVITHSRQEWVLSAYKKKLTKNQRNVKSARTPKRIDTEGLGGEDATGLTNLPLSTTSLSSMVNQTNREINWEIPTKTFDYIKRALDDQVQGQVDNFGKTTNEGRILNNLKNNWGLTQIIQI